MHFFILFFLSLSLFSLILNSLKKKRQKQGKYVKNIIFGFFFIFLFLVFFSKMFKKWGKNWIATNVSSLQYL